jgi:hypothetical protein
VPEINPEDSLVYELFEGNTGAAINAELEFDDFIKLKPKFTRNWLHFDTYLFADAGTMGYRNAVDKFFLSGIRADAGLGIAMTIKDWDLLKKRSLLPFVRIFRSLLIVNPLMSRIILISAG